MRTMPMAKHSRMTQPAWNNRFQAKRGDEGWEVIDTERPQKIFVGRDEREARALVAFCRQYVKRHGDIRFVPFPWSLDEPFVPDGEPAEK